MAFTQAQIDNLESAIATGASRVTYDGKTTEFQSTTDMLALLQQMKDEVAGTTLRDRWSRAGFARD